MGRFAEEIPNEGYVGVGDGGCDICGSVSEGRRVDLGCYRSGE